MLKAARARLFGATAAITGQSRRHVGDSGANASAGDNPAIGDARIYGERASHSGRVRNYSIGVTVADREIIETEAIDTENMNDAAAAEYIATTASQLARIAKHNRLDFIAYLIEMVALEAWDAASVDADDGETPRAVAE